MWETNRPRRQLVNNTTIIIIYSNKIKERRKKRKTHLEFGERVLSIHHTYQSVKEWKRNNKKTNSDDWCERFMFVTWNRPTIEEKFHLRWDTRNLKAIAFLVCNVNREWRDIQRTNWSEERSKEKNNSSNY